MTRIASLVLIGGALIVLLGTGIRGRAPSRQDNQAKMETGQFPSSWIAMILVLSAVSIEIESSAPDQFVVATFGTTPTTFIVAHWLIGGLFAAVVLSIRMRGGEWRRRTTNLSLWLAAVSLLIVLYEVFVWIPRI